EILSSLEKFDSFVRTVDRLLAGERRNLGKVIYELTRDVPDLRDLLSEYVERLRRESTEPHGKKRARSLRERHRRVLDVLTNLGIGEVVMVAPEGPHAIAGGLAQVIVGLMRSFAQCEVPTTVIMPLYERGQGNKHRSAEELLEQGVLIDGTRHPL